MWRNLAGPISVSIALGCDLVALAKGFEVNLGQPGSAFWVRHLIASVLGVAGFFFWFPPGYRSSPQTLFAWLIGLTVPLPVIGLLFLASFRLMLRWHKPKQSSNDYIVGDRQILTLIEEDGLPKATPKSMLQILSGQDSQLRRRAILGLRGVEPKKALPVLQKATQDSDEQVRLLAQTQFNKIMAGLELGIKRLEAILAKSSRDPDKLVRLAEQYHEMVYLGISSSETEVIYLERAAELLREALQKRPDHQPTRFLLMKCYVKNREISRARDCLEALRMVSFQPELLAAWEADICFQERDWPEVARVLATAREGFLDPRLKALADLWCPETEPA